MPTTSTTAGSTPTTLQHANAQLIAMLDQAAQWFDEYERHHLAKHTIESYAKAQTNRDRATEIRDAISRYDHR